MSSKFDNIHLKFLPSEITERIKDKNILHVFEEYVKVYHNGRVDLDKRKEILGCYPYIDQQILALIQDETDRNLGKFVVIDVRTRLHYVGNTSIYVNHQDSKRFGYSVMDDDNNPITLKIDEILNFKKTLEYVKLLEQTLDYEHFLLGYEPVGIHHWEIPKISEQ